MDELQRKQYIDYFMSQVPEQNIEFWNTQRAGVISLIVAIEEENEEILEMG